VAAYAPRQSGQSATGRYRPRSPRDASLAGRDLYPTLVEKAAGSLLLAGGNHPFVDGNKRVGHAVMETFVVLNVAEIDAGLDEQARVRLDLVAARIAPQEPGSAWT
jgi:death-on-curing protein